MSVVVRGLRNTTYLAAGNTLSHIAGVVGFVYIARKLGADHYGIYATVGAFVGAFEFLLLTGLGKVLVREGAKNLAGMHAVLNRNVGLRNLLIVLAVMACAVASCFAPYDRGTRLYILFYSAMLFDLGLKSFVDTVFQATEKMYYSALFGLLNRVIFIVLACAALYLGFGLTSLFVLSVATHFGVLAASYLCARRLVPLRLFAPVHIDRPILKQAATFTLIDVLGYLTLRIDVLMLSIMGTPAEVGLYAVASRLANQGVMLRNSAATAFFPIVVKHFQGGRIKASLLLRYSAGFLAAMLAVSALISLWAEPAMVLLFGEKFRGSGPLLSALIFFLGLSWARLPFTSALQATHNEKHVIAPVAITAILNAPLNVILYRQFGAVGIAYATVIVTFIGTLAMTVSGYRILKRKGHLE